MDRLIEESRAVCYNSATSIYNNCSLKINKNRNIKDILTNKTIAQMQNIIEITNKYTGMRKYNNCLVNI